MACSTCAAVRRAINVPLQRLGLPTFPNLPSAQAPPPTQTRSNPAWPKRGP